uniref:Uncharacterized protein n=1 Tax=Meloidogyne floridensis TaxID=298350 RepID=A0A915P183_9BILA
MINLYFNFKEDDITNIIHRGTRPSSPIRNAVNAARARRGGNQNNMENGRESNNNNRSDLQTNVNVNQQQDHSNRANNQENHFRETDTRRPNRARNVPLGDDARVPIREEDYPRAVPVQDNTINVPVMGEENHARAAPIRERNHPRGIPAGNRPRSVPAMGGENRPRGIPIRGRNDPRDIPTRGPRAGIIEEDDTFNVPVMGEENRPRGIPIRGRNDPRDIPTRGPRAGIIEEDDTFNVPVMGEENHRDIPVEEANYQAPPSANFTFTSSEYGRRTSFTVGIPHHRDMQPGTREAYLLTHPGGEGATLIRNEVRRDGTQIAQQDTLQNIDGGRGYVYVRSSHTQNGSSSSSRITSTFRFGNNARHGKK